jgi:hypothetical protein
MKEVLEQEQDQIIPEILKRLKGRLNETKDDLDKATPAQLTELTVALINALAHASHRTKTNAAGDATRQAITHLIRQVQSDIESTDPGDCAAIIKACSAIEFQAIVTAAIAKKAESE